MSDWLDGYICGLAIGAAFAAVISCVLVWAF